MWSLPPIESGASSSWEMEQCAASPGIAESNARRICGASHLYSLLGALLQHEGPEGNFSNVWIAVNDFYPFSCCVALSRLDLLSCIECLNYQALVKRTVLFYFAALGWKLWCSFCYMGSKRNIYPCFPPCNFRNRDRFALLGPPYPCFLNSIFRVRDWVQATI